MAAETVERLCQLLSLGGAPSLGEELVGKEALNAFLGSVAMAVEAQGGKLEELQRASGEARLRQVNLEQALKNLQRKRSDEQAEMARLQSALDEATAQIQSMQEERGKEGSTADEEKQRAELEMAMVMEREMARAKGDRLEMERNMQRMLERRQIEIDGLTAQVESASGKMRELRELLLRREDELGEAQSRMASAMRQAEMAQEEAEKYRKQAIWNAEELEKSTQDFAAYRKQKSGELASLQAQIEMAEREAAQKTEQLEVLRSSFQERELKLQESLKRTRDAETALAEREAIFVQEMDAKTRLADLYKEAMEEAMARLEETELLLQTTQATASRVDERIRDIESAAEVRIAEMRAIVEEKEQQLELLRGHLGEGSPRGDSKTIAEVYASYAEAKNELLASRQEISRLKSCIQDICEDLEARAPALQAERRENERLKRDITNMSHQLLQVSQARSEMEGRLRHLDAELRETRGDKCRLERQVKDLGKQVQSLLAEMEGIALPEGELPLMEQMSDIVDADQVIDERLVVFRNIQELQVRNQELVRVLRELSEQQETAELARLQQSEQELRNLLDANAAEVAELREHRQKQATLMESLVRQRDMLREMLSQQQSSQQQQQQIVPNASQTESPPPSKIQALEELRAEYEMYKEEKTESIKYLESQLERTQRELAEMRTKLAQAEAQLEFAQERHALLKQNYDMERGELTALRQNNGAAMAMITQHQSQMQQLMSELMSAKDGHQRLSTQLATQRVELDMTKAEARRTREQMEMLHQEKDRLAQLLSGLQAMAAEQDSVEVTLKQHLSEQIDSLTRELHSVRQKMAEEAESHRLAVAVADREYRDLVKRHEQLMESYTRTREEALQVKNALGEASKRASELEILHRRSEERFAQLMRPTAGAGEGEDENEDVGRELAAARAHVEALKDELRLEKEHSQTYQQMAQTSEQNLLDLTRTYDEFKERAEHRIQQLATKEDVLTRQLEAAKQQSDELQMQVSTLQEHYANESATLQSKLAQLQEYADMASSHSLLRKEDVDRLQSMVQESRQRYEQEVMAHARDLEQLHKVQAEVVEHQKQLSGLLDKLAAVKEQLVTSEAMLASERERQQNDTADIQRKVAELENQNSILMSQLESLTSRPSRRISMMTASSEDVSIPEQQGEEETGETSGLLQVVKYLRRQKEIIQLEHDSMAGEYRRAKSQCEALQRALDETRALLTEERNSNQWQAQMAAEYKQLLEKVEQLNLLRESNTTLRHEADTLLRRVRELETRLKEAQDRVEATEKDHRLLSARVTSGAEEMRLLREDRNNWKRRFEQILEKNSLDPTETDKLQTQIRELQDTVSQLTAVQEEARQKSDEALAQKTAELEAAVTRLQQLETKHKDLLAKSRQIIKTRDELSKRVAVLEEEAAGKPDVTGVSAAHETALAELQAENARISGALAAAEGELATLRQEFAEKNAKLEKYTEAFKKVYRVRDQYKEAQEQLRVLADKLQTAEQRLDDVKRENEMRGALLNANWQAKVRKLEAEIARLSSLPADVTATTAAAIVEPASKKSKTEAATRESAAVETATEEERDIPEEEGEDEGVGDGVGHEQGHEEENEEQEEDEEEEGEDEGDEERVEEEAIEPEHLEEETYQTEMEEPEGRVVSAEVGEEAESRPSASKAAPAAPMMGFDEDEDELMGEISDLEETTASHMAAPSTSPAVTAAPKSVPAGTSAAAETKPGTEFRGRVIDLSDIGKRRQQQQQQQPAPATTAQQPASASFVQRGGGEKRGAAPRGRGHQAGIRRVRRGGGNPQAKAPQ